MWRPWLAPDLPEEAVPLGLWATLADMVRDRVTVTGTMGTIMADTAQEESWVTWAASCQEEAKRSHSSAADARAKSAMMDQEAVCLRKARLLPVATTSPVHHLHHRTLVAPAPRRTQAAALHPSRTTLRLASRAVLVVSRRILVDSRRTPVDHPIRRCLPNRISSRATRRRTVDRRSLSRVMEATEGLGMVVAVHTRRHLGLLVGDLDSRVHLVMDLDSRVHLVMDLGSLVPNRTVIRVRRSLLDRLDQDMVRLIGHMDFKCKVEQR